MLVTKIDMSSCWERKNTPAPVMITATNPRLSGSSAAANEPKTASSTMNTIGKPAPSAFSRSSFDTSCMPAHRACWPTTCTGTGTSAVSVVRPSSSRSSRAASTAWSGVPLTARGSSETGWSPAAFAAWIASCGAATLSIPEILPTVSSTAAVSFCGSPLRLSNTRISGSLWAPGNPFSASVTATESEPGTSNPPDVKFLVCCAAKGREARRTTIHTPSTSRLRRVTNRSSRSMADCMTPMNSRRGRPCGNFYWTIGPLIRPSRTDTTARTFTACMQSRRI